MTKKILSMFTVLQRRGRSFLRRAPSSTGCGLSCYFGRK